jgi:hypothetical protein
MLSISEFVGYSYLKKIFLRCKIFLESETELIFQCNLATDKGMVRSDISKPALILFSLQEYTQQNPL